MDGAVCTPAFLTPVHRQLLLAYNRRRMHYWKACQLAINARRLVASVALVLSYLSSVSLETLATFPLFCVRFSVCSSHVRRPTSFRRRPSGACGGPRFLDSLCHSYPSSWTYHYVSVVSRMFMFNYICRAMHLAHYFRPFFCGIFHSFPVHVIGEIFRRCHPGRARTAQKSRLLVFLQQ